MNIVAVLTEPSPAQERFFHQQGWQVARSQMPGMGQAPIAVRDRFDETTLRHALKEPWAGGVETAGGPPENFSGCFQRHLAEGGLGLSLRSDTAYGIDVASLFSAALQQRLLSSDSEIDDLEFVLHEMISNALLHGNFGMAGALTPDVAGLDAFEDRVEAALADADKVRRRVQISAVYADGLLEVAVEDEGAGFAEDSVRPDAVRPHGLDFISGMVDSFRLEENGRRAVATFPFRPRQKPANMVSLEHATVLVVDDKKLNRDLLTALMTAMGVGRILQAEDGDQALARIEQCKPDLVLLDVMMPNVDGYDTCRTLRRHYSLSDLPVIFITALDGPSDRFACFAAGGNDVISKPLNNAEVIARVGVHLQLGLIMDKLKLFQDRVHDELQQARSAQLALTPTPQSIDQIADRTGLAIEGLMETSSELGGDFWTLMETGPRQLCLLMADFTGHGTMAAFNVFRLHLLLSRLPRQVPPPARLLDLLNGELRRVLKPGEFASVFVALIDLDRQSLTFSSAAAPPPVLVSEGEVRFLECEGPPLGAFDHPEFEEWSVPFQPGTQLLIYSDALVESVAGDALVCSDDTLLDWVRQDRGDRRLAAAILERFSAILPGDPPDDLSLVSVGWPQD